MYGFPLKPLGASLSLRTGAEAGVERELPRFGLRSGAQAQASGLLYIFVCNS